MAGLIPMFPPAVPGAIVVPAHSTNVLRPINDPKVLVVHTPEEPSDDIEVTPYYFQTPNLGASTHAYGDSDGDLYEMVPASHGAIANGVRNRPYPPGTDPAISLNYQSESIEFEGYAATIAQTMPRGGPQWKTGVRWIVHRCEANDIPIDRDHIIGHYQVADNRSDPGTLDIDQLVRDAQEEDDMGMTPDEKKLFDVVRDDAVIGKNRSERNAKKLDELIAIVGALGERIVGHEDWQKLTELTVAKLHPPED